MKFFELMPDPSFSERWFLSEPFGDNYQKINAQLFTRGEELNIQERLTIPVGKKGDVVDYNLGSFGMLITPSHLNQLLENTLFDRIQRIPVIVEDHCQKKFEILNILDVVECVDEAKSEFIKWKDEDNRPDKMGSYRCIYELHISEEAAKGHKMFRVKGWKIAVIVDEDIKQLIIDHGTTGVVFQPVN